MDVTGTVRRLVATAGMVALAVGGWEFAAWAQEAAGPPATCGGLVATIVGTAGDDVIRGTPSRDVIVARGGDDTVFARGGPDVVCAGEGSDVVHAGSGADRAWGGPGRDELWGHEGPDDLFGGGAADVLGGGDGHDDLRGGMGGDLVRGAAGRDRLVGGAGHDELVGNEGDDEAFGGAGRDRVLGRAGADRLHGGDARDRLVGGPGDDRLYGSQGPDVLADGDNADVSVLVGGPGADACTGSSVDRMRRCRRTYVDVPTSIGPGGFLVAAGSDRVVGWGGWTRRYTIEVEPDLGLDVDHVVTVVRRVLEGSERGWTSTGAHRLQFVDDPASAHVRIVLASPATVDEYCERVGLNTNGEVSCWDGARAMLNVDRWRTAVPHFDGRIRLYRTYLVNHEVGHGLGWGHEYCPAPGALAPVMQQQTFGLQGCRANGWPYP